MVDRVKRGLLSARLPVPIIELPAPGGGQVLRPAAERLHGDAPGAQRPGASDAGGPRRDLRQQHEPPAAQPADHRGPAQGGGHGGAHRARAQGAEDLMNIS